MQLIKATYTGHTSAIYQLAVFEENKFASCSEDKTIIIWDKNKFQPESKLTGHVVGINAILRIKKPNVLVSAGKAGTLNVWEFESKYHESLLSTVYGDPCNGKNCLIEFCLGKVLLVNNKQLEIIDIVKGQVETKISLKFIFCFI